MNTTRKNARKSARTPARRPTGVAALETLERRQMMTVTASTWDYLHGVLYLVGSSNGDAIVVTASNGYANVSDDGRFYGSVPLNRLNRVQISGMGGADILSIGAGVAPAVLLGGDGNDFLSGGNFGDVLDGGAGQDQQYGWDGNDTILANDGADTVSGGNGLDTADYSSRTTPLYIYLDNFFNDGAAGEGDNVDDTIETVIGGSGNDSFSGSNRGEYFVGNSGNDTIYAYGGNDTVDAGAGNDSVDGGDNNDVINGGAGADTESGGAGDDQIGARWIGNYYFDDAGNDVFSGAGGRDTVGGGYGNDLIHGGDDNDNLWGDYDNDTVFGDAGDDAVVGWSGDDSLYGGAGSDTMYGYDGNDGLFGGVGSVDYMYGGNGADRFLRYAVDGDVTDAQPEDANIALINGPDNANFYTDTSGNTHSITAAAWTDAQVQQIDAGFGALQNATGNTRLLKTSDGNQLSLVRCGAEKVTVNGVTKSTTYAALNFNGTGTVMFYNGTFSTSAFAAEAAIHEMGHFWDAEYNASGWQALSGWTMNDMSGNSSFVKASNGWWRRNDNSLFASMYATTDPFEDFAESFASDVMRRGNLPFDIASQLAVVGAKKSFIDNMISDLAQHP